MNVEEAIGPDGFFLDYPVQRVVGQTRERTTEQRRKKLSDVWMNVCHGVLYFRGYGHKSDAEGRVGWFVVGLRAWSAGLSSGVLVFVATFDLVKDAADESGNVIRHRLCLHSDQKRSQGDISPI